MKGGVVYEITLQLGPPGSEPDDELAAALGLKRHKHGGQVTVTIAGHLPEKDHLDELYKMLGDYERRIHLLNNMPEVVNVC